MKRQPIARRAGRGAALVGVAASVTLLGAALLGGAQPTPVHAQAIQATNAATTSKDPTSITFTLRVNVAGGLKSGRLEYVVLSADGSPVGGGLEATVSPIAEADLSVTLTTKDNQRYIPVGSIFRYHWTLTANDGTKLDTPDQDYVFLDGRYQWISKVDGPVTVYYYAGNEQAALVAQKAARESLEGTGKLLETNVPYPLRLVVYRSEDEGKLAMQQRSAAFDAAVVTGGTRVSPDLLHVFTNKVIDTPCMRVNEQDTSCVVRHEVGHVVTHVAGDGPFTRIPSWLDEGTAVYSQQDPGPGYRSGVEFAIRGDRTLPLRSIQVAVNRGELVDIFYGQSWSTVKYLVDTYGQPKFAELYRVAKAGARIDDALKTVYGFDQDGLYNEWRVKNSMKPIAVSASSGSNLPAIEATRAPLGIPSGGSVAVTAEPTTGEGAQATDAAPTTSRAGIYVLVGALVIAAALGGGGVMLLRKPSTPPTPPAE